MKTLLLLLFPLLCSAQTTTASAPPATPDPTPARMRNWTCKLNGFSAANPRFSSMRHPELVGRGLLNCTSTAGFTMEVPVRIALGTTRDPKTIKIDDLKVTVIADTFSVGRNVDKLYGIYEVDGDTPKLSNTMNEFSMRNGDRTQILPIQISIPKSAVGDWQIDTLKLSLVDEQPGSVSASTTAE
jgi:hypothetical protein